MKESFASRMRKAMDIRNMTQADLVKKTGLPKSAISQYYSGKAGEPIFAEEQFESYVEAGANIRADFCLKVKGDSMINARICDGDIVFIRKQPDVNDGEIAAVLIGNEATLKRVYKKKNEIILVAENPAYPPLVYKNEELNEIRILGKAIAFQSDVI
jgi:repressor LexA